MRLDKYLSNAGLASRSGVKVLLKSGKIKRNGEIVKDGKVQIDEHSDLIKCNDRPVYYEKFCYYLLNKPAGVISAAKDYRNQTVLDLLAEKDFRPDIFPVGRLDKDTEGLLLLTNDGALAHDLLSPKKHVEKEYYAEISGLVTEEIIRQFQTGLTLKKGEVLKSAQLEIISTQDNKSEVTVIIHEGKYHQVKRMFEAVGMKVTYLERVRMGSLTLPKDLPRGKYRKLRKEEVEKLRKKLEN